MLVDNLVDAEPNSVIVVVKTEDMIYEGFGLRMIFGRVKSLMQHFFDQL